MNEIDVLVKQAEGLAKNQVTRAVAQVRRETSIVNAVSAQLGKAAKAVEYPPKIKKSGVYTRDPRASAPQYMEAGTPYAMQRSVPNYKISPPHTANTHVRHTPVQYTRIDPGYRGKVIRKAIGWCVLALLAAAAALIIIKLW